MRPLPFISIVSTNWNSSRDILELLSSIKSSDYPQNKIEVIVIDNGSTDDSVEKINKLFPKTRLIKLPVNIGVAAKNSGLKITRGKIIFSIDSDVTLEKNTLKTIVLRMQSDPKIGLLTPKVLSKTKHQLQQTCIKLNFYTGTLHGVNMLKKQIKNKWYLSFLTKMFIRENYTFIAGLFYALPRSTLNKVGFYTTEFFFYGEDVDYCLRTKQKGLKMYYYDKVAVYHGKSPTTSDIPYSTKYHHYYKALFRNIFLYGNAWQKISVMFFQLFLIPFYRLLEKGENTFSSRWWGFYQNLIKAPRANARGFFELSSFNPSEAKRLGKHFWLAWPFRNLARKRKNRDFLRRRKKLSRETKLFIIVFIIGMLFRILTLNRLDFWYDEAFSYHIARLPLYELVRATITDNNPPLYYLLLHFVLKIGSNPVLLRLPSLIANLSVLILIYISFSKIIGKKISLIAAALFSVSPLSLYLATEARPHSLGVLIATIIIINFFTFLKNPGSKNVFVFIVLYLVGLYTHYYIAFLFPAFTWLLLSRKIKLLLNRWMVITGVLVLLFIPWFWLLIRSAHSNCACPPTVLAIPSILVSGAIDGVRSVTLRSFTNLPMPLFVFFSLTALLSLIFFLKGLNKNRMFALLYCLPFLILSVSGLFQPFFSVRGYAIFSPLFFIILSSGIWSTRKKYQIVYLVIILFAFTAIIQNSHPFFSQDKLKLIYDIIKQDQKTAVAHTSVSTYYSLNYYAQNKQPQILLVKNALDQQTVNIIGGKSQKISQATREIWLVDSQKWTDINDYRTAVVDLYSQFKIEKSYQIGQTQIKYLKRK